MEVKYILAVLPYLVKTVAISLAKITKEMSFPAVIAGKLVEFSGKIKKYDG